MAERKYNAVRVEVACTNCGTVFSYMHKTGLKRKHCSSACRNSLRKKLAAARAEKKVECSVDGCKGLAVRVSSGLCEKHYARQRRGQPLADKIPSYLYKTKAGYLVRLMPGHALAMADGRVHEHRAVSYEKHNGKCPNCFWCGEALEWKTAVIDHLDENKKNNAESNLLVSCNPCNRARGALLPFVARMRESSFNIFIDAMTTYRKKPHPI